MPPSVVEVAEGVLVVTSRIMSTTSTVVHDGTEAVLVDPAWAPDELAGLADLIGSRGLRVALGWTTHAHHDHVLWHPRFGAAPRLATPRAAEAAAAHLEGLRAALGPDWPADLRALVGTLEGYDGGVLPWEGTHAQVVAHDAHAPGHGALWLPRQRVLIAGDMLSDREVPLLEETGYGPYLDGLEVLAPYVARAAVLVPGHGRPAHPGTADSPTARLAADRAYLAAVARGEGGDDARLAAGPDWLREEHAANVAAAATRPPPTRRRTTMATPPADAGVVRASRRVAATPERIFDLVADPGSHPLIDGNDNVASARPGQRVRAAGEVFVATTTKGLRRENHVVEFAEGRRIAWLPSEPGSEPPGHLWRWEVDPQADGTTLVTHTYDWTQLTDENRFARARATTEDRLMASVDRLAALAEGEPTA